MDPHRSPRLRLACRPSCQILALALRQVSPVWRLRARFCFVTFMSTLEKIESWIFSRIVESIWWQTLTPHMRSVAAKATDEGSRKNYRRTSSSVDQGQSDFSLDLWKKAFRDACERLCPVRAGGHECGCLPLLPRLVMEQSVARLDVAMFNAILRESSNEIPSDPVSDPISDLKVLPIPAGKSSFGAGAQLKSVVHLLFADCKSCIQLPITNHASAVISNLLTSKQ